MLLQGLFILNGRFPNFYSYSSVSSGGGVDGAFPQRMTIFRNITIFFSLSDVAHWFAAYNYLISGRATPGFRNMQGTAFSLPDHPDGDRRLTLKGQWLGLGTQCKIPQWRSLLFSFCDHTWKSLVTPEYHLIGTEHEKLQGMQNQRRNIASFCSAESWHSLGDRVDPIGACIILHYIIGK